MMVFVLFLMYQEQQYEQAALEAQEQAAAEAEMAPGAPPAEQTEALRPAQRGEEPSIETGETVRDRSIASDAVPPRPAPRSVPPMMAVLENENVVAKISNGPELISSWTLKRWNERLPEGDIPIELISEDVPVLRTEIAGVAGAAFLGAHFEVVSKTEREVVQRAESDSGVLTRTIRLDDSGYGFDLDLAFESRRTDPVDLRFEILWPAQVSERTDFRELSLLAFGGEEGVTRELVAGVGQAGFFGRLFGGSSDGTHEVEGQSRWAGFDIRYFTGVVIDPDERGALDVRFEALEKGQSAEARISPPSVSLGGGGLGPSSAPWLHRSQGIERAGRCRRGSGAYDQPRLELARAADAPL